MYVGPQKRASISSHASQAPAHRSDPASGPTMQRASDARFDSTFTPARGVSSVRTTPEVAAPRDEKSLRAERRFNRGLAFFFGAPAGAGIAVAAQILLGAPVANVPLGGLSNFAAFMTEGGGLIGLVGYVAMGIVCSRILNRDLRGK